MTKKDQHDKEAKDKYKIEIIRQVELEQAIKKVQLSEIIKN